MSRYHQRRAKSLQNPEVAAGYWEMDSELKLVKALDLVRELEGITKEEMARRMQRQRVAISRLFNAERSNPTLETLHAALRALDLTAEVRLRRAREGDPPMTVKVDVPEKAPHSHDVSPAPSGDGPSCGHSRLCAWWHHAAERSGYRRRARAGSAGPARRVGA